MGKGTAGVFVRFELLWEALRQGQKGSTRANARTPPSQGHGDQSYLPPSAGSEALARDTGCPRSR
jgi:hypothetical protein